MTKPAPPKPRKPARGGKPRTTKRSAIRGRFGNDEKALDDLARRILDIVQDELDVWPDDAIRRVGLRRRVAAALAESTSVTETAAETIWKGWIVLDARGKPIVNEDATDSLFAKREAAAMFHVAGNGERVEPVSLVLRRSPTQPPKSKRSTK